MTEDDLDRILGQKIRRKDRLEAQLGEAQQQSAAMASELKRVVTALENEADVQLMVNEPGINAGSVAIVDPVMDLKQGCFYPSPQEIVVQAGRIGDLKRELAETTACIAKLRGKSE